MFGQSNSKQVALELGDKSPLIIFNLNNTDCKLLYVFCFKISVYMHLSGSCL